MLYQKQPINYKEKNLNKITMETKDLQFGQYYNNRLIRKELINLVRKCLKVTPKRRPSAESLMKVLNST